MTEPSRSTLHRRYKIRQVPAPSPHGTAYSVGLPMELGAILTKKGFTHVSFVVKDNGVLIVPRKKEEDAMYPDAVSQVEALVARLESDPDLHDEEGI